MGKCLVRGYFHNASALGIFEMWALERYGQDISPFCHDTDFHEELRNL